MPTPKNPRRSIADLLKELAAAVRARNRARATQLERIILRRLATEASHRVRVERRVRALMAKLGQPPARGPWAKPSPMRPPKYLSKRYLRYIIEPPRPPTGPPSDTWSPETGEVFPVWFGTNRKPTANGDGFTAQRHNQITRGRVEVFIPEAHRLGETGTPLWKKLWRLDLRNDELQIQRVERQERDAFFGEIQRSMQHVRDNRETSHALLFIHGFNVPFEEAAIRAAQIGCDLNVPGATAFFSWPSRGRVEAYPADEATIEGSEKAITDFLVDFAANCGAEKVHIIAHSMGNRGLLRAMQRIAANAAMQDKVKFGQIFLAAPDIDRDLFLDLAQLYPAHSERTTLYASAADLPVYLSSRFHSAPRAGYFLPYTVVPDMDTVAVPDFDIDLLGHSYFAQAEALLYDIRDLMLNNHAPARRQRIKSAVYAGTTFWKLKK